MTKISAPAMTPQRAKKSDARKSHPQKHERFNPAVTVGLAISMSWQLAIVVILPLVLGFIYDKHYHSSPKGIVVGLAVGAVGMIIVVRRTVQQLNAYMDETMESDDE